MGDFNKYIISHRSRQYLSKLGLREIITDKHGTEGPEYTKSNEKNDEIDDIWGSSSLDMTSCGYLPVNHGLKSDHRMIRVKISLANAFGKRLFRQKHCRPANPPSTIRLVRNNIYPSLYILPYNKTFFPGLEHSRITKNASPHLKLSRSTKKLTNS